MFTISLSRTAVSHTLTQLAGESEIQRSLKGAGRRNQHAARNSIFHQTYGIGSLLENALQSCSLSLVIQGAGVKRQHRRLKTSRWGQQGACKLASLVNEQHICGHDGTQADQSHACVRYAPTPRQQQHDPTDRCPHPLCY